MIHNASQPTLILSRCNSFGLLLGQCLHRLPRGPTPVRIVDIGDELFGYLVDDLQRPPQQFSFVTAETIENQDSGETIGYRVLLFLVDSSIDHRPEIAGHIHRFTASPELGQRGVVRLLPKRVRSHAATMEAAPVIERGDGDTGDATGAEPTNSLPLQLLDLSRQCFGTNLRFLAWWSEPMRRQFLHGKSGHKIAPFHFLQSGKRPESDFNVLGDRGPDANGLWHKKGHHHGLNVATNSGGGNKKTHSGPIVVASGPHFGHSRAMAKRKSTSSHADPHESKRHKFYGPEWVADGIDKLAKRNKDEGKRGDNRSKLIVQWAEKAIRENAQALRALGVQIPDRLFKKTT
jgi:hypothetical protein